MGGRALKAAPPLALVVAALGRARPRVLALAIAALPGRGARFLALAVAALPAFGPVCSAPRSTPDLLVVLDKADAEATLVDLATLRIVKRLPTGVGPHEVAATGDGRWAFVANYGTGSVPGHTLTVLDLGSRTVARTIELGAYLKPHGIAVSRDSERLWVTSEATAAVLELRAATGAVTRVWPTGQQQSHMLAVSRDERSLYVANIVSGSSTRIDLATGDVRSIGTGAGAEGIDVTPDGSQVWVANREANTISVVDARANVVRATLGSGAQPIRVRFTPDGAQAWVTNSGASTVDVFQVTTRRRLATLLVGGTPIGIAISPDGRRAYVANTAGDRVTVIDARMRRVLGSFATGREPDGLAWARGSPLRPVPRIAP